ncbi:hypothetical protein [Pontibacter kalidii]|uniref:hypothetical protein n=1 Tax=Pontibacter kalidii TaxID=2592049 RepID=UPI00225979BC|nr:hypothetical protein [Pontibacter kalidii]
MQARALYRDSLFNNSGHREHLPGNQTGANPLPRRIPVILQAAVGAPGKAAKLFSSDAVPEADTHGALAAIRSEYVANKLPPLAKLCNLKLPITKV